METIYRTVPCRRELCNWLSMVDKTRSRHAYNLRIIVDDWNNWRYSKWIMFKQGNNQIVVDKGVIVSLAKKLQLQHRVISTEDIWVPKSELELTKLPCPNCKTLLRLGKDNTSLGTYLVLVCSNNKCSYKKDISDYDRW